MKKITYLIALLGVVYFISCKKDNNTTPSSTSTNNSGGLINGDIYAIAGNGYAGYSGDGGAATAAELGAPTGVAVDQSGNIYIADNENQRIRKISISGMISTIAGNGFGPGPAAGGYSGDGGPATAAELDNPNAVAVDVSGNIYIADLFNGRIRKVNTNGIISTFAGGGTSGLGDGGPATAAELRYAEDVALDNLRNVYIVDGYGTIRKVNTAGIISTIAGNGLGGSYSGDGGPATAAGLYSPNSVAVDNSGNIYIADTYNQRIRKVNTNGIISTIAGNGAGAPTSGAFSGDGGPATAAEMNLPEGVVVDYYYNVYFTDQNNHRVRVINTSGIIITIAGNGTQGYSGDGGLAINAELNSPYGIALNSLNDVFIADWQTSTIRIVK